MEYEGNSHSSIVLLEDGLRNPLGCLCCVCSFTALTTRCWKSQLTGLPSAKRVPWGQKCIFHLWIRICRGKVWLESSHLPSMIHWLQWSCAGTWRSLGPTSAALSGGWCIWNRLGILMETSGFSGCSGESPSITLLCWCRLSNSSGQSRFHEDDFFPIKAIC